ncbi:uncharacterized protein VTP21DRAFT_9768 [Calcarisporiella thermophila]|uniref:uncharacterized protein n=1 Tax=Calcarisporiella thermophila TaxID=911321 RepID=UPI0037420469
MLTRSGYTLCPGNCRPVVQNGQNPQAKSVLPLQLIDYPNSLYKQTAAVTEVPNPETNENGHPVEDPSPWPPITEAASRRIIYDTDDDVFTTISRAPNPSKFHPELRQILSSLYIIPSVNRQETNNRANINARHIREKKQIWGNKRGNENSETLTKRLSRAPI